MPKGNPNPSPETRFQPGNVANPGGKTKELKRLEVEAAEMSARLRHAALSAMMEKLNGNLLDVEDIVKADMLRLFKDSEDRAHGTPKASAELSGPNGGPIETADRGAAKLAAYLDAISSRAAGKSSD